MLLHASDHDHPAVTSELKGHHQRGGGEQQTEAGDSEVQGKAKDGSWLPIEHIRSAFLCSGKSFIPRTVRIDSSAVKGRLAGGS